MKYDPHMPPDLSEWSALPEGEQFDLVLDYHRSEEISLPNELVHAAIHVTIENQIALGDELPVGSKLEELMGEGLDRHEALHAIGSVLAEHIHELLSGQVWSVDPNARYIEGLKALSKDSWIEKYSD